jgi:hypothetical protein
MKRAALMLLLLSCAPEDECADLPCILDSQQSEEARAWEMVMALWPERYNRDTCQGRKNIWPNPSYPSMYETFTSSSKNWCFGDSTAASWHPSLDCNNRAVPGNTSCNLISQLPRGPADFVLFSTPGGNDVALEVPLDVHMDQLERLLVMTRSRFPGAKIVLVDLHPLSGVFYARFWRAVLEANERIRELDACVVDAHAALGVPPGWPMPAEYQGDGIHYDPAAFEPIRAAVRSTCGMVL